MEIPSQTGQECWLCQWCRENVFGVDTRTRIFELRHEHTLICRKRKHTCDYCLCEGEAEEFSILGNFRSLTAILHSAAGGCFSCVLIQTFAEHSKRRILFRVRMVWSHNVFPIERILGFLGHYFRIVDFEAGADVASTVISQASDNESHTPLKRYSFNNFQSDPLDLKTAESAFIANCDFISSQLTKCKSNHPRCRERKKYNTYPSRLLQLSGTPENPVIRLIQTKDASKKYLYTCLSYCWGGRQPAKTTTANIAVYAQDIIPSVLQQTILDGIKTTLGIGLSYIWVDAYCIIQDSEEDKNIEISNMANIYKGATCTLSISSAKSAMQGFLQDTVRRSPQHAMVEFDPSHGVIMEVSPDLDAQWSREQIIHTRAWTLQETMLSETIVFFGKAILPVQFRCATEFTGTYGSLMDKDLGQLSYPNHIALGDGAGFQRDQRHDEWLSIVTEYSTRQMTLRTDKLAAIGAIAAEFQSQGSLGGYLAGLWSKYLILGLLWHTPNTESDKVAETKYLGPSWSWVSRAHPVHYQNDLQACMSSNVVYCETTLVSTRNPTGAISSAVLKIRCRAACQSIPDHQPKKRHLYFDDHPRPTGLHEVWVLYLAHLKANRHCSFAGLLIQKIKGSSKVVDGDADARYRRIGMFRNEVPAGRTADSFESTNLNLAHPENYPVREFILL